MTEQTICKYGNTHVDGRLCDLCAITAVQSTNYGLSMENIELKEEIKRLKAEIELTKAAQEQPKVSPELRKEIEIAIAKDQEVERYRMHEDQYRQLREQLDRYCKKYDVPNFLALVELLESQCRSLRYSLAEKEADKLKMEIGGA